MGPMTIAVAGLLVSALSTTGLLALWAANSRRHWFVRTAAFLGVLSPLLLVPAFEPFIALSLQGAIVALGAGGIRWALSRKRRKNLQGAEVIDAGSTWRFSMATLLLAMVLCGVAAAIAATMPGFNRQVWQSIVLIGVCGSAATLAGYWAATRLGWRRRMVALIAACVAGLLLGLAPAWLDWFVPSLKGESQWPPAQFDLDAWDQELRVATLTALWSTVTGAVVAISAAVVGLASVVIGSTSGVWTGHYRRLWRGGASATLLVVLLLTAAPSVYVLGELLTPDRIPIATLPDPNGFDDFVAAGRMADAMNAGAGVDEVAKAIGRGRQGLARQSVVPLDYANGETILQHVQLVRNLSRLFDAEGQRAKMNGAFEESVNAHVDNVRLGTASRRGGLIVDGLVGVAITGVGASGLFNIREDLTATQCLAVIQQLTTLETDREPYAAMEARDRVWAQHAMGWYGRLHQVLDSMAGARSDGMYKPTFNREAAIQRLIIAHLALQAYRAEHGRLPSTWDEVTAEGLPELMTDPWSRDGETLQYRRTDDGYLLYSVGPNEVDNGGSPPKGEFTAVFETGDFSLEALYAPETAPISAGADGAEGGSTSVDE